MSSLTDQTEYLRKKKEEILAKKKAQEEQKKQGVKPESTVSFANDGSFLEKFKSIQNQTKTPDIKKEPQSTAAPMAFANDGSFMERFKAMQEKGIKQEPDYQKMENVKPAISKKTSRFDQRPSSTSTSAQIMSSIQRPASVFEDNAPTQPPQADDYEVARELAEKVHNEGKQAEMIARIQGRTNPKYK
uniref:Uncharacterized protein n=1 Tax=Clytia hemisphaerica TaxID=252671 RepID=A0A7M5XKG8_9CNID